METPLIEVEGLVAIPTRSTGYDKIPSCQEKLVLGKIRISL